MSNKLVCCTKCRVPLVMDFSRPAYEWRCPKCDNFTQYFDDHVHLTEDEVGVDGMAIYTEARDERRSAT